HRALDPPSLGAGPDLGEIQWMRVGALHRWSTQQQLAQVEEGDGGDGVAGVGLLENGPEQGVLGREPEEGWTERADREGSVEKATVLGLEARAEEPAVQRDLRTPVGENSDPRIRRHRLEIRLAEEPAEPVELRRGEEEVQVQDGAERDVRVQ